MKITGIWKWASLGLVVVALAAGCRRSSEAIGGVGQEPAVVKVARVEFRSILAERPVAGTVRPLDRAQVAARLPGVVAKAEFAVGQRVAAGEVLVELEAAETAARLAQARAVAERLRSDLARESALAAQGAAAPEVARALADQLRAAEAAVEEAKVFHSYTRVAAPFSGVIARKWVNVGDHVGPGSPLFELSGEASLRAEAEVPASLGAPAIGAAVAVQVGERRVEGVLAELADTVDPRTRTRLAKVELPAGAGARAGDFVRVFWPAGEESAFLVPEAAVRVLGQMEQVFVVEGGAARLRLVKTAGRIGDRVRISAGLSAGELVVLNPAAALRDGQSVLVEP